MVKFWNQIYKQWNPTKKIMFWLAIISIIIGIFSGGKWVFNDIIIGDQNIQIQGDNNQINFTYNYYYGDQNNSNKEEKIYIFVEEGSFIGNCDHIHLEKEANTTFKEGTIALWIKLHSFEYSHDRYVFDMIDYSDNSFLQIYVSNNQIIKSKIFDNNGQEFSLSYDNDDQINDWIFIVVSWNENEFNLFVNDKKAGKININNADFSNIIKDWYMGSNHKQNLCLRGLIDEVSLYNSTADKYDVINLYEHYEKNCRPIDDCYKKVNLLFKLKVILSEIF